MGNCLFGVLGEEANHDVAIKVITSDGGIMEFGGPITVECITDEFPHHGIFRDHDLFWNPLPHHEVLIPGGSYYLLPLATNHAVSGKQIRQIGHVRSNSVPESALIASYRMSFDGQGRVFKRSYTNMNTGTEEFFATPRCNHRNNIGGVWKVKLVISPKHLLEILSQEHRTQELIESVRTVAKCGNIGLSALGFSDQWSLSSSSGNNTIAN